MSQAFQGGRKAFQFVRWDVLVIGVLLAWIAARTGAGYQYGRVSFIEGRQPLGGIFISFSGELLFHLMRLCLPAAVAVHLVVRWKKEGRMPAVVRVVLIVFSVAVLWGANEHRLTKVATAYGFREAIESKASTGALSAWREDLSARVPALSEGFIDEAGLPEAASTLAPAAVWYSGGREGALSLLWGGEFMGRMSLVITGGSSSRSYRRAETYCQVPLDSRAYVLYQWGVAGELRGE